MSVGEVFFNEGAEAALFQYLVQYMALLFLADEIRYVIRRGRETCYPGMLEGGWKSNASRQRQGFLRLGCVCGGVHRERILTWTSLTRRGNRLTGIYRLIAVWV